MVNLLAPAVPCYSPVTAYTVSGGGVTFTQLGRFDIIGTIQLPCNGCIGCRLDRASMWSLRVVHEASLHAENCFVTLTYDEAHLPPGGSLRYRDCQLFIKRLRRANPGKLIRYYLCGEYGDNLSRPHYHICLFGHSFSDQSLLKKTISNSLIYHSPSLTKLWPLGLSSVGSLNKQSAGYTARYCMKKINGDLAESHYRHVDPETGEITQREPEFNHMSLKPGIGAQWYDKFHGDVHLHDHVIHDGRRHSVPHYYNKLASRRSTYDVEQLKQDRILKALPHREDNTPERLAVKAEVKRARIRTLLRSL
ncbi:MAG: replication initiator protein [Microvirus sp.]|nr:MAG: replication initiator protein [Microvirus sp.]